MAIKAMEALSSPSHRLRCVIFTGDVDATSEAILKKAKVSGQQYQPSRCLVAQLHASAPSDYNMPIVKCTCHARLACRRPRAHHRTPSTSTQVPLG